jgi:hypothetical protein
VKPRIRASHHNNFHKIYPKITFAYPVECVIKSEMQNLKNQIYDTWLLGSGYLSIDLVR